MDKPKKDILNDPRFANLINDPRFKNIPHYERKVKIDKRFQSMFKDEKFKLKYTVDKYGRRVNKSTSEDLKKYYEIDSDAEDEAEAEAEAEERRAEELQIIKNDDSDITDDENSPLISAENDQLCHDDGEQLSKNLKTKLLNSDIDFARGEGRIITDSSSDDETSSEDDDENELYIEHVWGELDNEAETTTESTSRLAACNMDWDRIRASDILVLCNSFLPLGGTILSVKIFPSDFGKQRMQEEDVKGPSELLSTASTNKIPTKSVDSESESSDSETENLGNNEDDSDLEEGDDYHMEKLRKYQLNRLKYYYAVIECDSIGTADKLYKECDGLEYESTATKLNLRFIPNDIEFMDNEAKDICTDMPDLNKYKPRLFTTTALQQAKVELTWDETPVERKELSDKLSAGKLDDINDADLRKFVAYSSDSGEEDEESANDDENLSENDPETEIMKPLNEKLQINKYKSLLEEINNKETQKKNQKYEMEYTWGINVNTKTKPKLSVDVTKSKKAEQMTPIEKALEKKHEKNKKRKEERKKRAQERNGEQAHKKNSDDSSDDDMPDGIDLNDPYFAEEFANGDFEPIKNMKKTKKPPRNSDVNSDVDAADDKLQEEELELLLEDNNANDKNHFSLNKILQQENPTKSNKKRKQKLKKAKHEIPKKQIEDDFQINTNDQRFQAIYQSHLFNIDPTHSHFKKTKGMEQIIQEKLKRRQQNESEYQPIEASAPKKSKKQMENLLLIKNLKRKIQHKKAM